LQKEHFGFGLLVFILKALVHLDCWFLS